ncbi:MAG: hypothetical protein KGI05_06995 [Thaumarchaeota archaeon]|nr:hypothetical protein [Nitrososphaerota archaeon]
METADGIVYGTIFSVIICLIIIFSIQLFHYEGYFCKIIDGNQVNLWCGHGGYIFTNKTGTYLSNIHGWAFGDFP